ncbi:MAG: polysaccharide biosynthesis tyrosine autokinase [Candidatus Azobacteroides sp.]|nr:polysaccharide biosynthesis tyrosine autokinase [Candidatus Azobacteroides sp.]
MENNKREENARVPGKEINFQWFIISFLIHWKWFVISVIVFLLAGYIKLRYSTSVYNVESKIVLRDSKRGGLGNSEVSIFERLGYLESGNNNVENEIEVIKSRDLIETTVVEAGVFIRYSVKGRFKDTDLYGGFGRQYYASPPVKVFVDKNVISSLYSTISLQIVLTDKSTILVHGQYGNEKFVNEFSSVPAVLKTPVGEVLLLPDENVVLKKDYPLYIQIIPPLWIAQSYVGSLSENLIGKNSTVVTVSLHETNPKRGEDFLSRLFQVYNRETMSDKTKSAENASIFIKDQLEDITKKLRLSENVIETYKRENQIGLVIPDFFSNEINDYTKQVIANGTNELRLSYLQSAVEKNIDNKDLLPGAVADGIVATYIENYNQRLLERNRLLAYTKEDAPIIKKANERLSIIRVSILAGIQAARYSLGLAKKETDNYHDYASAALEDTPRKERELTDFLREQLIQSNYYIDLLRRKQDIEFTLAVSAPSAKVIESPLTFGLIAPRRNYIYFLCLSMGLIFPFVIIGIRELMNYKLTQEEEVRRFSEMPVIVSLPIVKTKTPIVVSSHATTAIVERFRLLRTNLQFILDTPEKKSILVTSTISGEGKTFVAINLALTFSLKYKTILLGLDIRRPKINSYLNIPKQMGLISYLTGEETNLNSLIHRNINGTNLDVLISGMIPLNPNELLIEPTLDKMLKELREQYDYIIIDSSPVGSVSDAFLLNRVGDVTLFVVRNNLTPKSAISLANKVYDEKRLNNVNMILNGFAGKNRYGYGYGYGYGGYGYGYGYGYGGYNYGYNYGYGYESDNES